MNETMTPDEAARVLAQASRWEGVLVSRTEGLTWMIWGIATPAMFVTYGFAAVLAEQAGARPGWWMGLLWIPWVAMGVLATSVLWRTAAISHPALGDPRENRRIMLWTAGLGAAFAIAFAIIKPDSGVIPLAGVGAMWALFGALNVFRSSGEARVVSLVTGGSMMATALVLGVTNAPIEVSGTVTILVSAAAPFAAGLWHVLRA